MTQQMPNHVHHEGTFNDANQQSIYWQQWLPSTQPEAIVLLVHGIAEHSGRYERLALAFTQKNYAVCALDHLGHGNSAGQRTHIDSFTDLTGTIETYRQKIAAQFPATPLFLLGHSLGGLISLSHLIDKQDQYTGAILSGPALKVPEEPSIFLKFIVRAFSLLLPKIGVLQIDGDGISRDPIEVKAYFDDPKIHNGKISARMIQEIINAAEHTNNALHTLTLPMLCMHGGADKITDAEGSKGLFNTTSSKDKTLKIYPELYHEIYNEPERELVTQDTLDWIEARL